MSDKPEPTSWNNLIRLLRDQYGCIIWISPVRDGDPLEVVGWYFEGEWIMSHENVSEEGSFYFPEWHETSEKAEESAVRWACEQLHIETEDLIKPQSCYYCDNPATKLCDGVNHYLVNEDGMMTMKDPDVVGWCDRPICEEHSEQIGISTASGSVDTVDFCPKHVNKQKFGLEPEYIQRGDSRITPQR